MSEKKDTPLSPVLVWIDLEMTGLDPQEDVILEIATVITNNELDILAEGPNLAIHYPDSVLSKMNAWVKAQHTQSGLVKRVQESTVSLKTAEEQTLAFIQSFIGPGIAPLCGNSIHMDRFFLTFHMKDLTKYLHYRNIDVSTLKELARRWHPALTDKQVKKNAHLAREDILESISELKRYRQMWLESPNT